MATLTAKELAVECNTDARTVRKFLRSHLDETPGKGSRYAIERRQVKSLKKAFQAWDEKRNATNKEPEVTDEVDETEIEA